MSPWAPFRRRAFFWLRVGVVISSVGTWAQTVGAQWLFVSDPNVATIVTLVQTASTLAMMSPALLLALSFALGAGMAVMSPTWQALITELVPRSELTAATW